LNPVSRLAEALSDVAGTSIELDRPGDPAHGDYATNAALRRAGVERRPPRELAEEIASRVRDSGLADAEVAGPGFVNLRVSEA
jgi:arginyl-tRNA synthetase